MSKLVIPTPEREAIIWAELSEEFGYERMREDDRNKVVDALLTRCALAEAKVAELEQEIELRIEQGAALNVDKEDFRAKVAKQEDRIEALQAQRRQAAASAQNYAIEAGQAQGLLKRKIEECAEQAATIERLTEALQHADSILDKNGYTLNGGARKPIRAALKQEPK